MDRSRWAVADHCEARQCEDKSKSLMQEQASQLMVGIGHSKGSASVGWQAAVARLWLSGEWNKTANVTLSGPPPFVS
ncbi:hypothetical protein NL676_000410 [Syzygium grande]|nr:hypothetical protein NL676_000410 [Syzygium grande]